MRKLICIPTFNEVNNIENLINSITLLNLEYDIVVIDDDSPDGTADKVKELMKSSSHLDLIQRTGKRSFALSYIDGFNHGLKNNYDYIGEMDADFSHNPNALVKINQLLSTNNFDFIVGSRYVSGGCIVNWGMLRRLISRGGSLYAKILLNTPINDLTGGFNFWSNTCLRAIDINHIVADGYVFQIELKAKAVKKGMRFSEFPITFEDRRVGKSKMSNKTILEAIFKVLQLSFELRRTRILYTIIFCWMSLYIFFYSNEFIFKWIP